MRNVVISGVLDGSVDKGKGDVVLQGYNTLLRVAEIERKVKETEDLEARMRGPGAATGRR